MKLVFGGVKVYADALRPPTCRVAVEQKFQSLWTAPRRGPGL